MFTDISVRRESNCPVHFVWDGNGLGRPVVRLGFLLALVAGAAMSAGVMFASRTTTSIGATVGIVAGVTWALGQLLTRWSVWRAHTHH
jgi:hypothetical protein